MQLAELYRILILLVLFSCMKNSCVHVLSIYFLFLGQSWSTIKTFPTINYNSLNKNDVHSPPPPKKKKKYACSFLAWLQFLMSGICMNGTSGIFYQIFYDCTTRVNIKVQQSIFLYWIESSFAHNLTAGTNWVILFSSIFFCPLNKIRQG